MAEGQELKPTSKTHLAAGTVVVGEVTTLKHELRNDSVESRAGVTEALLTGAESTEVGSGLWDDVVV